MWLTIFLCYWIPNFICAWWFVANLGVKHAAPWQHYVENMFSILGELEFPRHKEEWMFIGLFFAVTFIAIPYMIFAAISCKIDDYKRDKLRKQWEHEATQNREQIIKDFIDEKKRKAGLDE